MRLLLICHSFAHPEDMALPFSNVLDSSLTSSILENAAGLLVAHFFDFTLELQH